MRMDTVVFIQARKLLSNRMVLGGVIISSSVIPFLVQLYYRNASRCPRIPYQNGHAFS